MVNKVHSLAVAMYHSDHCKFVTFKMSVNEMYLIGQNALSWWYYKQNQLERRISKPYFQRKIKLKAAQLHTWCRRGVPPLFFLS